MLKIVYVEQANGPQRLICDVELHMDGPEFGFLNGLKWVGFSLWQGVDRNDVYVTFPSRAFGTATDRKYFDYLRAIEPGQQFTRAAKDGIVADYLRGKGIPLPLEMLERMQKEELLAVIETNVVSNIGGAGSYEMESGEILEKATPASTRAIFEAEVRSKSVLKRESVQQGKGLPTEAMISEAQARTKQLAAEAEAILYGGAAAVVAAVTDTATGKVEPDDNGGF